MDTTTLDLKNSVERRRVKDRDCERDREFDLVPSACSREHQRVKVYRLNEDAKWEDQGTGHVTVDYMERSEDLGLFVVDEEDNETLLLHRITPDDIYRKQEDTIISWRDLEYSTELALSFQETTGCSYIWDHICYVQRNLHFSPLNHDTFHSVNSELRELPAIELSTLSLLLKIVVESGITDQMRVTELILHDQGFFRKLMDLFRFSEDCENLDNLHIIYKIVKGILMLNSAQIFEKVFSDEFIMDIIGCLEYDPDVPHVRHRDFLKEHVVFKEAIPIKDPVVLSKIHQTYRIGYLKDVVLPRVLDDATVASLNSIVHANNGVVVSLLKEDGTFVQELFSRLRSSSTSAESKKNLVFFLYEFCTLSRSLQMVQQHRLFRDFVNEGIFDIISDILQSEDKRLVLTGTDILILFLNQDPNYLRGYVVRPEGTPLLGLLVQGMLTDFGDDMHCQFLEILRTLLDSYTLAQCYLHNTHKLPPGPLRWPIVGNLLQLGPLPHRNLASYCEKYGPLVYLKLGNVDSITTNDPEVIREILVRQDDIFASRPHTLAAVHLAYNSGDVALAPMGPKWKRMRRICMEHLLTTKRLELFVNHRAQEAQHLVQDVWTRAKTNEPINLREVLGAFSMNNVTRMLLGKQYFGVETAGPQEALEFMHVTHELFSLLGLIYLGDFLPIWRWVDPYGCENRMREVEKKVDDFHCRIIEEHKLARKKREEIGEYEGDFDFVDVLLSLPGEDGKENMDDVDIKALIQDMIAAATDTSAVTNEWAMAEVIKCPRVLHKIQQELDKIVGPNRMVNESDIPHLNYLRCVVRETFRLHPAGPFLIPHESLRPTTINGYDIPKGTRVFINTHGLGRNPKVWDNVEEFYPERHLPLDGSRVEISHGSDFKILPFSAGKRRCPGAPLGVVFVLLALARLFHAFNWLPPHGMKAEEIDTQEVYGLTMPKAYPLMALAKPRLAPPFVSLII